MDSDCLLSHDESRLEETTLEEYGKAPLSLHQQSQPPKISRLHTFATRVCHTAIAILLFLIIILLGTVLSKRRGGGVHQKGSDLRKCPSEAVHVSTIEGSHDHGKPISSQWRDCGSTIQEARAKGCVYDVVLVAWLQPDCFDSELHEAYLSDHDYPFWLDRSLETPTTLEEVRLGNHDTVYSSAEFHLAHCAYFMEQSVRGFRNGRMVDNITLDNEHTEHCARSLRDQWLPEMGFSPLHMDFHSCGMP